MLASGYIHRGKYKETDISLLRVVTHDRINQPRLAVASIHFAANVWDAIRYDNDSQLNLPHCAITKKIWERLDKKKSQK